MKMTEPLFFYMLELPFLNIFPVFVFNKFQQIFRKIDKTVLDLIEDFIESLFHFFTSNEAPLLLKITFNKQHHMLIYFLVDVSHFDTK